MRPQGRRGYHVPRVVQVATRGTGPPCVNLAREPGKGSNPNPNPNPNQHVRRQGRRGAAFMPRVAHAPPGGGACGVGPRVAREPGGGRSGRRACHTWHINRAGGRAGGVGPRLVREPGRGATRGTRKRDLMPRAAWKLSKCHTWHQILFFRAMRGTPGREATRGTRKRDLMPRVA